jgi:branched-chain amino acid transport system substrate-binding protein
MAAIVMAGIVSIAGCSRAPDKPKEYKIGVVLALTGRGATYGQDSLNGMQLAVDELNAEAKKNGDPQIRMIVEDSQSDGPKAEEVFRKLIDKEKIFVGVGFTLSDEALYAAPLAEQRKVVLFSPSASSDDLKNAGDYVFRNRESAAAQAEAVARAAVERFGKKNIAVLHSNSANGISYRDAFVNAMVHLHAGAPKTVGYDEGKTDYSDVIGQLRTQNPDAVYLIGLDKELGLILKESNEMGFKPQFFGSSGAISPKLLETAAGAAEGLICGSAPFHQNSTDPRIQKFVKAYKDRFGLDPEYFSATSYDAIQIIAELMKQGALDSDSLKKGLYGIKNYNGIGGMTTFDQYGEVSKPIDLVQVKGGKFEQI